MSERPLVSAFGPHDILVGNGAVNALDGAFRLAISVGCLAPPHPLTPGSTCDTWLSLMRRHLPNPTDALAAQEFAGYSLMPAARYGRALVLCNADPYDSIIVQGIKELVGRRMASPLEQLRKPEERWVLRTIPLNVSGRPKRGLIEENACLRELATQGLIDTRYKYQRGLTKEHLPTKHIVALAKPPYPTAASMPWAVVLHLETVRIQIPHEEREILNQLDREMPGMIAWAVEGAVRLVRQGGFSR